MDQAKEFSHRRSIPGVEVRYMHTKRSQDIVLTYCGHELGSCHRTFTRGKETDVSYILPPLPDRLK